MPDLVTALSDFPEKVLLPLIRTAQSYNRRVPRPVAVQLPALSGDKVIGHTCLVVVVITIIYVFVTYDLFSYVVKAIRSEPGKAACLHPEEETDDAEAPETHTPCVSQSSNGRRTRSAERPNKPGLAEESERREKESKNKGSWTSKLPPRRNVKKQPGLFVSFPYPEDSDDGPAQADQPPSEAGCERLRSFFRKKLSARASDGCNDSSLANEVSETMRSAHDALVKCTKQDASKANQRRKKSTFGVLKQERILNKHVISESVPDDDLRPQDQAHDRPPLAAAPAAKNAEALNVECARHSPYSRSTKAKRKRQESRSINNQSVSWPQPESSFGSSPTSDRLRVEARSSCSHLPSSTAPGTRSSSSSSKSSHANAFGSPPTSDRLRVDARSSCSHLPSSTAPGTRSSSCSSKSSEATKTTPQRKQPRPTASPRTASGEDPSPVRAPSGMQIVPEHRASLGRDQTTLSQAAVTEAMLTLGVTRTLSATSTPLICDASEPALPTPTPRPRLQKCDAICLEREDAVSDEVESRDVRTDSTPISRGQAAEGVVSEPDHLTESIGMELLPSAEGMARSLEVRRVVGQTTADDLESLVVPNENTSDAIISKCDDASNGVGLYKVLGSVDSLILTTDKLKGTGSLAQASKCADSIAKNPYLSTLGEIPEFNNKWESVTKLKEPEDVEDRETVLNVSTLEHLDNVSPSSEVGDHSIMDAHPVDSMELITDKMKGTGSLKQDPKSTTSVAKNPPLSKLEETSKLRNKWRATPKLRKKLVDVEDSTAVSKKQNSERVENVPLLRKVPDPNILKQNAVGENVPLVRKREAKVAGRFVANATPKLRKSKPDLSKEKI